METPGGLFGPGGPTPRTGGRGRILHPVQRLMYPELGNPTTQAFPVNVRTQRVAPSVVSRRSVASRKSQIELEAGVKMSEMESKFEDEHAELEMKLDVNNQLLEGYKMQERDILNKQFKTDDDLHQLDSLKNKIFLASNDLIVLNGELKLVKKKFENGKKAILKQTELKQKLVDVDEDNSSQDLGSDEELVKDLEYVKLEDRHEEVPVDDHVEQWAQQNAVPVLDKDTAILQLMQAQMDMMKKGALASPQHVTHYHSQSDKKLPPFDGTPSQWCQFISAYDRTSLKYKWDNSENMSRIMEALRGDAKGSVQHLGANPDNVPLILDVLKRTFGRPELVLNSLVEEAKASKPVDLSKPETLVKFGTTVEALIMNIKSFKRTSYLQDRSLVEELLKKLPVQIKSQWFLWIVQDGTREATIETFSQWLKPQVDAALLQVKPGQLNFSAKERGKRGPGASVNATTTSPKVKSEDKCSVCDMTNHQSNQCYKFRKMSTDDRWKIVAEKKLCMNCLSPSHFSAKCRSSKLCGYEGCSKKHHQLLHRKSPTPDVRVKMSEPTEEVPRPPSPTTSTTIGVTMDCRGELPIVPVKVKGPNGTKIVYALLDSASELDLLQEDIATELGLTGSMTTLQFKGLGDVKSKDCSSMVIDVIVGPNQNNNEFYQMHGVRTLPDLGLPPRTCNISKLRREYPYLRSVKGKDFSKVKPKMLIGFPSLYLIAARRILENPDDRSAPCACDSLLGWYISTGKTGHQICCLTDENMESSLDRQMKSFFSTEDFGVKLLNASSRSREDMKALEILDKTTVRISEKKWETGLLWRNPNEKLPESYEMALNRLRTMERKMDRDPDFRRLCHEKFQDYISKGYLVKHTENKERQWYLPWFFAYHPTKKPRLVFDAAAKSFGKSLNDFLFKGPDLLLSLTGVLTRFRRHQVAISGDIKEMFHQVALKKTDRSAQLIMYREDERQLEPTIYEMSVLFFGSASSPSSAIFTKTRNAEEFYQEYPEAVDAIKTSEYMDDHLSGHESEDGAIRLLHDVIAVHGEGGFPIQKWNSNSREVLTAIPKHLRSEGSVTFLDKMEIISEKTLGLYWNPVEDIFQFNLTLSKVPDHVVNFTRLPTKREMASLIMSLFDPLGFVAPVKVQALIIMQLTWKSGVSWDTEIPEAIAPLWKEWLDRLTVLRDIKVPRKFTTLSIGNAELELHTFTDSSQEAFSAVTYLRAKFDDHVEVSFVLGKARVAPVKYMTIPRLELQGALLGARLVKAAKLELQALRFSRVIMWTDARTVLLWIRNVKGRLNQFVGNRVGEILEITEPQQWRWIPTSENPADDATRLVQQDYMTSKSRWIVGPEFLKSPEDEWPKENKSETESSVDETDLELKPLICTVATVKVSEFEVFPPTERYSSWVRMIRATAAVFMAIRKFKGKIMKGADSSFLGLQDMKRAKILRLRQSQHESFPEDVKLLKKGMPISKGSRLAQLCPALNEDGIIILKGRINRADVDTCVKEPVILDSRHHYTKLWIEWVHETGRHFGQERVLNEIRKEAWVLDARKAIRSCWSRCLVCAHRKANPIPPMMGQLPKERVTASLPFESVGIDYFGPFTVTVGRATPKRWGVLFTCLSTRAVHLDIAEDLSSSEFVNILTRFICLRGRPKQIWSDNGTNFVGARRELEEFAASVEGSDVQNLLLLEGIKWSFIPPAAPHMGGSWERMVGCVKKVLSAILREQSPKESTMRTVFAEICNILNSRPLTFVSMDVNDEDPITPNHLLKLRCDVGGTLIGASNSGESHRRSWKYAQLLADEFWRRWSGEYLPQLAKRTKWYRQQRNIQAGDVVVVLDDLAPRNLWKKGLVLETVTATDGQVRSAKVKVCHVDPKDKKKVVKTSIYHRPVVKLCPLPVKEETVVSGRKNVREQSEEYSPLTSTSE